MHPTMSWDVCPFFSSKNKKFVVLVIKSYIHRWNGYQVFSLCFNSFCLFVSHGSSCVLFNHCTCSFSHKIISWHTSHTSQCIAMYRGHSKSIGINSNTDISKYGMHSIFRDTWLPFVVCTFGQRILSFRLIFFLSHCWKNMNSHLATSHTQRVEAKFNFFLSAGDSIVISAIMKSIDVRCVHGVACWVLIALHGKDDDNDESTTTTKL